MKYAATLVIPVRNREAARLRRLISSLRREGGEPRFIVVDYGSEPAFVASYKTLANDLDFEVEVMEARGLPWNKSRAINRGARLAQTDFVCTADADIYFASDPLAYCLEQGASRTMFHVPCFWLGPEGAEARAVEAGKGSPGGFQLVERAAFESAGGYDERIVYWGIEDLDWPERLRRLGYVQKWLPEPHRIYHQWHRPSEFGALRPATASYNSVTFGVENRLKPVLEQAWGRALARSDRPILDLIDTGSAVRGIEVPVNSIMHGEFIDRILETRGEGSFVRLDLGPRLIQRPLSRFSSAAKAILRPLAALTSNSVVDKVNANIDYLYCYLPVLEEQGLRDYYIDDDFSRVYLLWG